MNAKIFGGMVIGTILGGGLTYAICRKHHTDIESKYKAKVDSLAEELNMHKTTIATLQTETDGLYKECERSGLVERKVNDVYQQMVSAYQAIADVNMIADIANIKDIDVRDECLTSIEHANTKVTNLAKICFNYVTDIDLLNDTSNKIDNIIKTMTDTIKTTIIDYDQDDDDDDEDVDDNEIALAISPKHIILKCLGGQDKIFKPESGSFEVLDGSDPDENDFCILAENVKPLYDFLFMSIKNQLKSHYVSEIDLDTFDEIIDDMIITVSLAYINETDTVITAVNAVVPFEIFGDSPLTEISKTYSINETLLMNGDIQRYFDSRQRNHSNRAAQLSDISAIQPTTEPIFKFVPDLSDDTIRYIVQTIGYNRDALKSFIGKLEILLNANFEAGDVIRSTFFDIATEIDETNHNGRLDDAAKNRFSSNIRALILNMKRNYGMIIRGHS